MIMRDKIAEIISEAECGDDRGSGSGVLNPEAISDDKDKRIEELEAAIKRQAGAAKTLRNATLADVQHIRDNERKQYAAIRTLDSERDANAMLTDENDALKARIAELDARNRELALDVMSSDSQAHDAYERQKELKAKLAKVMDGLRKCEGEIDQYIRQEYPHDHPVQERYRQRDFAANPARATLAELQVYVQND